MNLQENIQRIKSLIEQVEEPVQGKCGISRACEKQDKEASREMKLWDKEVARQNKEEARQKAIENRNFLSLDYDRDAYQLDKQSRRVYKQQYQDFMSAHPGLLDNSDGFNTEQKYAIITKTLDFIKRVPQISYTVNLKSKFGLTPTSTLENVIDVVNKMGGWVSYMDWFNQGGPKIK